MNSYMRSPRSVTAQPMGMPLRILQFAMDFFARVMMAFCTVICPSSCAAVSSNLTFWLASPSPMFTVTFFSLGTAIMFFQPKCFISVGTVSFRYFSCNRLFIAALVSPLLLPFTYPGYLSKVLPQRLHERTLVPSGKMLCPMLEGLLQFEQPTMTLGTLCPPSFA